MTWVQSCADADFNTSTMTCAAPIWTPETSSLPTMSIADAQAIGMQIALLFAVAWGIKMCKRALNEIG